VVADLEADHRCVVPVLPLGGLPIAFAWLTTRGDDATARWMKPILTQPEIRCDTVRVPRAIAAERSLRAFIGTVSVPAG
jgi:hypothetical protein